MNDININMHSVSDLNLKIGVFVIHSDLLYLRVNIIQIDKIFQVAEIVSEIDYSCTFIKRKLSTINVACLSCYLVLDSLYWPIVQKDWE